MLTKSKEELLAIIKKQEAAILKLEDSNQLKVKWINLLVHDLRGLLGNTIWFIDNYLKRQMDESVFLELLPELKKTAAMQLDGFNKTVVWTREQSNNLSDELMSVDLSPLITSAIEQNLPAINRKKIEVKVSQYAISNNPQGYPLLTQFIIKHVLDNAIKFTDTAGVIIIDVAETAEHNVYVEITDNGIGMDEKTLRQIYNPDKIKYLGTAGEKGIGITLLICKDFMEMQNGKLHIDSVLGQGSKVKLEFTGFQATQHNQGCADAEMTDE